MNFKKLLSFSLLLTLSSNSFADSIAQLLQQGKIPAVQTKKVGDESFITLNLSGLGIDSLVGLGKIPGIETVQVLALNDNALTIIPDRGFSPCKNVTAIGLERNNIKQVEAGAFAECFRLKSINLNKNNLSAFAPGTFAGPEHLEVLSLNRNPGLTKNKKEIQRLKQELPKTKITTGPFTGKQWAAIGVGAAVIAAAIAAAVFASQAEKPIKITKEQREETVAGSKKFEAKKEAEEAKKEAEVELLAAAHNGNYKGIEDALYAGADVNAQNAADQTALMFAAQKGQRDGIELLLRRDATVNIKDKNGKTAIDYAREQWVKTLLLGAFAQQDPAAAGAEIAAQSLFDDAQAYVKSGDTQYISAEFLKNPRAMSLLITSVDDKNQQAAHAQTILWMGVEKKDVPFTPLFEIVRPYIKDLKNVSKLKTTVMLGETYYEVTITPLYAAIAYGNTEAEQALINAGLGINMLNKEGSAPLHAAAKLKDLNLVEKLLRKNANPNVRDSMGRTPLHWAALGGFFEIAQTLLNDSFTVPDMLDNEGNSALDYAVTKFIKDEPYDDKLVQLLIEKGAKLSEKSYNALKEAFPLGMGRLGGFLMKKQTEQVQKKRKRQYQQKQQQQQN